MPQTVTLSVTAQQVADATPRFGTALDAAATNVALDWSVILAQVFTLSLRPAYERFRNADSVSAFGSFGLALARRAPRSPWSASMGATYTRVGEGGQWRGDAGAGLRVSRRDQLTLQARYTRLRGVTQPFSEKLVSLRLTHRF